MSWVLVSLADQDQDVTNLVKPVDKTTDLKFQEPMTWSQEIFAVLVLSFFPGCLVWMPLLITGSLLYTYLYPESWFLSLIPCFVLFALIWTPVSFQPELMHRFPKQSLYKYFSFKIVYEEQLDRKTPMILIAPPHGVFPFTNILNILCNEKIFGINFRGATATAALRAPVMRQVMAAIGCVNAGRKSLLKTLKHSSIGICPDGVAGIFTGRAQDETVYIAKRKGFVRIALKMGCPLVPVYQFGNTQLWDLWYDDYGILASLSRKLGFGVLIVWGRWGTLVLKRTPLLSAVGKPIPVPKIENPTEQDVDKYHKLFLEGLTNLFEKYKGNYGWSHKTLVIS